VICRLTVCCDAVVICRHVVQPAAVVIFNHITVAVALRQDYVRGKINVYKTRS
jgi:hypothetical protein